MGQRKTNISTIIITVIITAVVSVCVIYSLQYLDSGRPEPSAKELQTYTSERGFSFKYPLGYTVSENVSPDDPGTLNVFIAAVDEEGNLIEAPPVMQVNVSPFSVSFSLWEGIQWDDYPTIIESFEWQ